jgi:bifunctional NMN adenylyltransferase/nudix hydrolase
MKYSLAVFVGRFQPFHLGHQQIIDEALTLADRVLVLIGSSFEPRSLRNPWFFDERKAMIRACYTPEENKRILCEPIIDIRYNNSLWITQVQKAVYDIYQGDESKITLIGRQSKGVGYYTSLFPQWQHTAVTHDETMCGTEIRDHLFKGGNVDDLGNDMPQELMAQLTQFVASNAGKELQQEQAFIEKYKKGWENVPFEPTHVTVDAVVIQSGHVLLVKRGAQPGKGLLALPGGFIHHEETLLDALVRKLKEETQIKVPAPALIGSIKNQAVFDAPFRSSRGRTITHAFFIELRGEETLPKIKGGGETSNCFWMPLGQLDSTQMFEDHYFIIQKMLGII